MKNIILAAMSFYVAIHQLAGQVACPTPSQPPQEFQAVYGNEIRAAISREGQLFSDGMNALFQVPYDSTTAVHTGTIFAGALWLGGYDSGNNLKMAAQTYRQTGSDYFDGPLNAQGVVDTGYCPAFNRIWRVDVASVERLIQDYLTHAGSILQVDSVLLVWPGRNNPHFQALMGFPLPSNRDFAPFFDKNGDGDYDPFQGDYPVFEHNNPQAIASSMVWTMFNDNGGLHTETNGQALKVEVQLTAYALYCPNDSILNRTIFTRHRIISRNSLLLTNVLAGLWFDSDMGCYNDDYMGTAVAQNAVFFYNSDNNDDSLCNNIPMGYGVKPPVQSIMFLNRALYKTNYYENTNNPILGNPSSAIQYYRLMNGANMSTGVSNGVDYVFDGQPSDTSASSWTMVNDLTSPGDYRTLMSVNIDSLLPNAVHDIDAAYVYHRDTSLADNIEMTNLVYSQLPLVQDWYDNGFPASCFPSQTLALRQAAALQQEARLYPNPNAGQFSLELPTTSEFRFLLMDATGRMLYTCQLQGANKYELQLPDLASGLYFYQLTDNAGKTQGGKLRLQRP